MDPSAKPAAIDFEHKEGVLKGKAWKGIYALDGDTLTICDNAPNLNKGRPTTFEIKSGSGYVLITFKRATDLNGNCLGWSAEDPAIPNWAENVFLNGPQSCSD
jgi:hypothetical protein